MVAVERRLVTFRFLRPSATEVGVVGDFPAGVGSPKMQPIGGGYWAAAVFLPPGSYRFRYHADGEWFNDYAAFGLEHGPFGLESVVRVEEGPSPRTLCSSCAKREAITFGKHAARSSPRLSRIAG